MDRSKTQFSSKGWKLMLFLSVAFLSPWVIPGRAQSVTPVSSQVQSQNPYDGDFSSLKSEFTQSSPARQAVLLARGYKLREFVDDAGAVGTWLRSVAENDQLHPLVRDEARRYVAAIDVHTANLEAAKAELLSLGLVRDWAVLTSSNARTSQQAEWRPMGPVGPQLWIDLSTAAPRGGTVYAATSVYAETPRAVALRFSSEAEISVSLNGVELASEKNGAGGEFDQYAVGVQLAAGWNSILLRVESTDASRMRFALRVTEPQGGGIQLKASSLQARERLVAAAPLPVPPVADLVDMAASESKADPGSKEKLQTLGMIELQHARGSALDHLEAAALRGGTADYWIEMAAACADQPCSFRALTAAMRGDKSNERATVALADYYIARAQMAKARELLRQATQIAPNDFVAQDRMIDLNAASGLNVATARQAHDLLQRFPAPLWVRTRVAERYYELGLLDESRQILRSVLQDKFDDAPARKLMSDILRRRRDSAGLEQMAREDARLGPSHHNNTTATNQTDDNSLFSSYLQDAPELAAAAHLNPPAENANAVALSDTRVERVGETGLSSVRVQQVYYIATEQGARQYTTQTVQYAPSSQRLRVVHARIYKSDGRVVEGRDGDDSRVADTSVSMYYDVRSHEVEFPGLEKGDVVELDYSIVPTTTANPYGNYFGNLVVFRTSTPERLKRYVLIASASRKLNIVEARMPAPRSVSENSGDRVYQWEARDLAALPNETRGPAVTEFAPYVHVSTFASWTDLGRWYAEMIKPQFATNSDLRSTAARLVAGKKTEFEKVNAIYQFVLHNTHYVAMEFGIYSYKPYPVTQTYSRGFGDCKDKASLMIALLREAGIEADFVLLRTRHMGDIDRNATSIALFNHAIVHLPKWDMWLDGTADYFTSGELPAEDQGAMALVVSADGSSSLRQIPITRPEDNYTRRVVRAAVTPDGRIQFQGDSYTRGEDAPGLRREFEVPGRQRDSFRSSLAQVLPSVRVDDVRVSDGGEGPAQTVNVQFRGTIDNSAGQQAVSLATSWTQNSYVQKLAPLVSRTQDLLLPAPWTREEELRFQLPANAQVVSMPNDTDLKTQFGTARIHYERHGHEVVISTSLQVTALRITPAEYGLFREFCQAVERAFRNEVKVSVHG